MQINTIFLFFCLLCYSFGKELDENAIHQKLDTIESRIADDLQKKYGGNVVDIKQNLAEKINGAVDLLIEKIKKERADKQKIEQPVVVETKSVHLSSEEAEGKFNEIIQALEDAKISVKKEGKERIQDYINYLKQLETLINESKKSTEVTDAKEPVKDEVQKTEDKIDDFLEEVTEDEESDPKNQDFIALVKKIIADVRARRAEVRKERQEHIMKIFGAFEKLKKNFEKKAQQKAERQKKHFEHFLDALKNLTSEFEAETASQEQPTTVIQEFSVSTSLTPTQKREKLQKIQELKDQIKTLRENEKAKEAQSRKELFDQLRPFFKRKVNELTEKAKNIKEEKAQRVAAIKEFWADFGSTMDEIRTVLDAVKEKDRAEKKAEWDEIKEALKAAVAAVEQRQNQLNPVDTDLAESAVTANQEIKATFLDDVTGVSSWQTVTWVLLSICIILAVALLVAVFKQNTMQNKYEHLDGSDIVNAEFEPVQAIRVTNKVSSHPTAPLYPKDQIKDF